jgi:hypothetical protein
MWRDCEVVGTNIISFHKSYLELFELGEYKLTGHVRMQRFECNPMLRYKCIHFLSPSLICLKYNFLNILQTKNYFKQIANKSFYCCLLWRFYKMETKWMSLNTYVCFIFIKLQVCVVAQLGYDFPEWWFFLFPPKELWGKILILSL